MSPDWDLIGAAGAVVAAAMSAGAGLRCGRSASRWWVAAYVVPLGAVLLVVAAWRIDATEGVQPFEWLREGRRTFAVMTIAAPMVLATLVPRLAGRRQRVLVGAVATLITAYSGVLPFVLPVLVRGPLSEVSTRMSGDVCRQSTAWTCGPAAAVTALRRLGVRGEEGPLGVEARTAPLVGTRPALLADAIRTLHGGEGVTVGVRRFADVDELRTELAAGAGVLLVVKQALLVDHFVAVLEVRPRTVIVADPLMGLQVWPMAELHDRWRRQGLIIRRDPPERVVPVPSSPAIPRP